MSKFISITFVVLTFGCTGNSNREPKSSDAIRISAYKLEAIPDSLSGCSCLFSETEEDYESDKYLYFDDIGENAVISIDGSILLLKALKDEDAYSDGQFKASIVNKVKIDKGYESTVYSADLIVSDRLGNKVSRKVYGICGC